MVLQFPSIVQISPYFVAHNDTFYCPRVRKHYLKETSINMTKILFRRNTIYENYEK